MNILKKITKRANVVKVVMVLHVDLLSFHYLLYSTSHLSSYSCSRSGKEQRDTTSIQVTETKRSAAISLDTATWACHWPTPSSACGDGFFIFWLENASIKSPARAVTTTWLIHLPWLFGTILSYSFTRSRSVHGCCRPAWDLRCSRTTATWSSRSHHTRDGACGAGSSGTLCTSSPATLSSSNSVWRTATICLTTKMIMIPTMRMSWSKIKSLMSMKCEMWMWTN